LEGTYKRIAVQDREEIKLQNHVFDSQESEDLCEALA